MYDEETGFYYLRSRYYEPYIGRFLNADSYASTGQGLDGHNMFAYCNSNPIMSFDPSGMRLVGILERLRDGGASNSKNIVTVVVPPTIPPKEPESPIWPIANGNGYVTNPYDENSHVAIDIAYDYGTSINACVSGTVTKVVMSYSNDFYCEYGEASYGNYIDILGDDGFTYRYAHLKQVDLFGDVSASTSSVRVEQGQKIGEMGCTGHTMHYDISLGTYVPGGGVHLHLEIIDSSGKRINPLTYIERG